MAQTDLHDPTVEACGHLLDQLLGPRPDLLHTLRDAVTAVEAVDECRRRARNAGTYAFGMLPSFLLADRETRL